LCLVCVLGAASGGCQRGSTRAPSAAGGPPAALGTTIGALAEVVLPAPLAVEGYGLVGGLAGTGSGYCPPEVRAYLKQYVPTQLPHERVNVDELINNRNTAVVALEAMIPALPSVGERLDVRVSLLAGSEATSLHGGWLYKAELVPRGTFGAQIRPLATVEGPVFIDSIGTVASEPRRGWTLGGGRTLHEYTLLLRLRKPDYRVAGLIRNRLSERYGPGIAQALSPREVEVRIPADYRRRKQRFASTLSAMFLEVSDELLGARINTYVKGLTGSGDRDGSEIALEAIGRECAPMVSTLLNSPEAEVRLRAGRCLVGLGDSRGLTPLRDLALDPASPYRLEALEALMVSPRHEDAAALGRRLLRDAEVPMVLATYEHLRRMEDPAIVREAIGRGFTLEQVVQSSHKAVFVSRSGEPRIVLFGAPLRCRDNLFVESPDQTVILDARTGQGHISVIRKHPKRPGVIGPVRSSLDLGDLIRILGSEPATGPSGNLLSLGLPYGQVIALLERVVAQEAVAAEFWAGPLPKIDLGVKK